MLIRLGAVQQWRVEGLDGTLGSMVDVLLDEHWVARAMVVQTGRWSDQREVAVPPDAVRREPGEVGVLHVNLMREQLQALPDAHAARCAGAAPRRSSRALIGCRVAASDGDAGDLDELAIDDESWGVHYLIVDTQRWWPGGRVMVEPVHVQAVHDEEPKLLLSLRREALQRQPAG